RRADGALRHSPASRIPGGGGLSCFPSSPERPTFALEDFAALLSALQRRAGFGEALALAGVLPLAGVRGAVAGALALAGVGAAAFHAGRKGGGRCKGGGRED